MKYITLLLLNHCKVFASPTLQSHPRGKVRYYNQAITLFYSLYIWPNMFQTRSGIFLIWPDIFMNWPDRFLIWYDRFLTGSDVFLTLHESFRFQMICLLFKVTWGCITNLLFELQTIKSFSPQTLQSSSVFSYWLKLTDSVQCVVVVIDSWFHAKNWHGSQEKKNN